MKIKSEQNVLFINGHVNYTKTIERENGEFVKLVARYFPSPFNNNIDICVDVFKKENNQWIMCRTIPTNNCDTTWVSQEHYINVQRKEMVAEYILVATIGQLIKITQEFKNIITTPPNLFNEIQDDFNTHQFKNIKFKYVNLND